MEDAPVCSTGDFVCALRSGCRALRLASLTFLLSVSTSVSAQRENPLPPEAFLPAPQAAAFAKSCLASKAKVDQLATPENSFRQEFAPGVVLRVPKCIYPAIDYAKAVEPIKAKTVRMVFRFPDMTIEYETQGTVETFLQKQKGEYVQQKDSFPVFVIWLWHVKPDADFFVPGSKQPAFEIEPRPPRIELNRHCYKLAKGRCVDEMVRIPSGLAGMDAAVARAWLKKHPEARKHDFRKGGYYLAKPDSPYELVMDCGAIHCQARLYSKTRHFQLRLQFPSEGVEHADELFKAIDRMLGRWSSSQ